MKNVYSHKEQALVFRQWSGKNYAVFASLGKEVNIGHIDIDVCDKAFEKDKKKRNIIIKAIEDHTYDLDEFDDSCLDNAHNEIVSFLLTLNSDESSRYSRTLIITYNFLIFNSILFSGYEFVLY